MPAVDLSPTVGFQFADSKDVRSLNLQWYRSQRMSNLLLFYFCTCYFVVGLVSQEPILFDMSIKENIAYGDNSRQDIPMADIIAAAKNANIHDFIQRLPDVSDQPNVFVFKAIQLCL